MAEPSAAQVATIIVTAFRASPQVDRDDVRRAFAALDVGPEDVPENQDREWLLDLFGDGAWVNSLRPSAA